MSGRGVVYLVGAGPGDPGLITQRGIECLNAADVVLYDYLVNPQILVHAGDGAQTICLGQHGRTRIVPQADVNRQMIEAAQAGKTVVRLKGGDPIVFARIDEEVTALRQASILHEIVPGVTAALAVGSYAGIALTDRDQASCVALITGQESPQKETTGIDFAGLAAFPGTLVFYMGVTSVDQWSSALLAGGKPASTPVAVVRRVTLPNQESFRCDLGSVIRETEARQIRPPALFVVGEVAGDVDSLTWFTSRPLFGQSVLVTRPSGPTGELQERLVRLGAVPIQHPAIEIGPPEDWSPVDQATQRLSEFHWIVFSSRNGVSYFFDRLRHLGLDLRALGGVRVAAIGPMTAAALQERGLIVDLRPSEFRAEALAAALTGTISGGRVLLVRASRGREVLAETLRAAGIQVEQIVAYQSTDVRAPDPETLQRMQAGQIPWTTVTSSAIAKSVVRLFGEALKSTRLVAISPITAETLREAGYPPAVVAEHYTAEGLVDAILASPATSTDDH